MVKRIRVKEGRGRPRKGEAERVVKVTVRFSKAEAEPIMTVAEAWGMPLAVWARESLLEIVSYGQEE